MYPHRIRLRGPWDCEPLAWTAGAKELVLPSPRRMTIPCRWAAGGLPGFSGQVRFRRRFGYPGQIDPHERVWLTCAGLADAAEVSLNDTLLGRPAGEGASFAHDITSLLRPRNELVMDVSGQAERGGIWGEVQLEVRCTAWLQGITARVVLKEGGAELLVSGLVMGTADRPLEVYAVLNRRPAAYGTVAPAPAGQPFELCSGPLPPECWRSEETRGETLSVVQIDLVNGAEVWYTWEETLPLAIPPGG
jgi:hypothetical protein